MKLRPILVGLVGAGVLPTMAAAAPLNVRCLSAGGFYGRASFTETDGVLHVDLGTGLGLSPQAVARDLGVLTSGQTVFIGALALDLPKSDCKTVADDALLLSCSGQNVELTFTGDQTLKTTVARVVVDLTRVTRTSVSSRSSSVSVSFRAQTDQAKNAVTSQEFKLMPSLPAEGCNVVL